MLGKAIIKMVGCIKLNFLSWEGLLFRPSHFYRVVVVLPVTRSGPNIPAVDLLEEGDFFGTDHFDFNEL